MGVCRSAQHWALMLQHACVQRLTPCCGQVEKLRRHAGRRRYMLESTEFWAMAELEDLSRGAFSQLPAWLQVTHVPAGSAPQQLYQPPPPSWDSVQANADRAGSLAVAPSPATSASSLAADADKADAAMAGAK